MAIRVLFLCTGNSARSVLAEAALRQAGGDAFEVFSAGTQPKGLNPYTLRVLSREGIDTSGLRSQSLEAYSGQAFDYVITVCDNAAAECPTFPGTTQRLHWSFPDPAAVDGDDRVKLAAFDATLEGLRRRIEGFVEVAQPQARS